MIKAEELLLLVSPWLHRMQGLLRLLERERHHRHELSRASTLVSDTPPLEVFLDRLPSAKKRLPSTTAGCRPHPQTKSSKHDLLLSDGLREC